MNPMADTSKDRLHGTLDALVLKTLTWGPRHGYAISRWLKETSKEAIVVEEGSLYPALYRMERNGWIEAEWSTSELGRKTRTYRITPKGRKQLKAETERFAQFVSAVSPILLPNA
jgi:PadR family transcriptional regulator PadR